MQGDYKNPSGVAYPQAPVKFVRCEYASACRSAISGENSFQPCFPKSAVRHDQSANSCPASKAGPFTGVSQNATGVSPWMNGHNKVCAATNFFLTVLRLEKMGVLAVVWRTPLPEKHPRCRPRNAPSVRAGIDGRHVLLLMNSVS